MNVVKAVGWRKLRFRFDWTLTLSALVVAGLGLVNLWSAVHERRRRTCSRSRSPGWALGAAVFLAVAALDYRTISRLGYILYGVGVAMLLGVIAFGKMVGGGRRWFDAGPFHVQPSEMVQVLTIVALGQVPERFARAGGAVAGATW